MKSKREKQICHESQFGMFSPLMRASSPYEIKQPVHDTPLKSKCFQAHLDDDVFKHIRN